MARSFKDAALQAVVDGKCPKGFPPNLLPAARRKLFMIVNAAKLQDLLVPPGDRLETLKGNRQGQHSVRINDKWRVCFCWAGTQAEDLEITDYH